MSRALVTGGAGFVGSHLVRHLCERGDRVTVLDDLSTGRRANLEGVPATFVEGDARDATLVGQLMDRADVVYHLASAVGVRLVVENPVETIENSVGSASVVLRAAAERGVRFVLTSTSEVYGKRSRGPFLETDDIRLGDPTRPRWAYACSKALDEWLTMAWHREAALPVVVARLFNTVGPGQLADYGMVLPRFVRAALRGEPLQVHGDGRQTRTFTHVHDAAASLVALGDDRSIDGEIVNVGGWEEVSIADLARRVVERCRSDSDVVLVPYAEAFDASFEDMQRRIPDVSKLERLTGHRPGTPLDDILDDVIAWERAVLR